ncbi:MAG TPA: hypothetical protein VFA60_09195 [Terriglobales bacterium]|nr:hypothetical protein [Terriglobales bacterium]
MRTLRNQLLFATALLIAASALAQVPKLDPYVPEHKPRVATVTFSLDFPGSDPSHYAMSVEAAGDAAYASDVDQNPAYATPSSSGGAVPLERYDVKFTMPQATRERIFALAQKLKYFQGSFDYTKGRIANTGAKKLVYADESRYFETSYNWSQNEDIQELTRIFQSVGASLEFGRRLEHQYRYTKLALDDELKRMEDAANAGELLAIEAVAPTLEKIVNDRSVLHIARIRAQRLLARAGPAQGATSPTTH